MKGGNDLNFISTEDVSETVSEYLDVEYIENNMNEENKKVKENNEGKANK